MNTISLTSSDLITARFKFMRATVRRDAVAVDENKICMRVYNNCNNCVDPKTVRFDYLPLAHNCARRIITRNGFHFDVDQKFIQKS